MKKTNIKSLAAVSALAGSLLMAPSSFADTPYDMEYSGGAELSSSNVQITPNLVSGLSQVISDSNKKISFSSSDKWKEGYASNTTASNPICEKVSYFVAMQDAPQDSLKGLSYTISNGKYTTDIQFNKVSYGEDLTFEGPIAIAVMKSNGSILTGYSIFNDSECQTERVTDIEELKRSEAQTNKVFAQLNIKLKKDNKEFISDKLYFGITDIDMGQSYKILNTDNVLKKSNMYASSAESLQPPDEPQPILKNMFVSNKNYIYSEVGSNGGFNIEKNADIYVKTTENAQKEGLDIVFGFAHYAGSNTKYFAKQYLVQYISDDNGVVSGIDKEDVISGDQPSGSSTTPNEGYELVHWTPDVDVTLKDGTKIKAGEKMTSEQITNVVVEHDITFKAFHEKSAPATPNTGMNTQEFNAIQGSVSIIGIIISGLIISRLPRAFHKKIKFNS